VRPLILWRHEIRRAGAAALAGPPIAVAAGVAAALAHPMPGQASTARILLAALEMAVPLAAGVACASLVGRDPASEIHLTTPTPYRVTLFRRMVVTLAWTAVVAVLAAVALIATAIAAPAIMLLVMPSSPLCPNKHNATTKISYHQKSLTE